MHCCLKVLRGFFEGSFLVTQNAEMKMRLGEIRLQPQRFGKFGGCALRVRLLHQHGTEIVMQFRPFRFQLDRAAEFADGAIEITGKIKGARQNVVSLGVVPRQPHRFFRFPQRGGHVSLSRKRAGEIHVRQREIRIQFHGGTEMNDCRIDFSLCEQYPAQGVVSFRAVRRKPHHFLEIRARGNQIALLQRRHAVLIGGARPRSSIRLHGTRGLRGALQRSSAAQK